MKTPRKNKSKKEVVLNIQQAHEADRLRILVREKIFPFLLQLNDTIAFTKIFLQVAAVTVDTAFNNTSKDMKVKDLIPKFETLYKDDSGHNKMYMKFFELLGDETVSSFVSLIQMTPQKIEAYFTQENDKRPIMDLPIDKVLG